MLGLCWVGLGFMIGFLLYGLGNCDWEIWLEIEVEVGRGLRIGEWREGGFRGFSGWGSHYL